MLIGTRDKKVISNALPNGKGQHFDAPPIDVPPSAGLRFDGSRYERYGSYNIALHYRAGKW